MRRIITFSTIYIFSLLVSCGSETNVNLRTSDFKNIDQTKDKYVKTDLQDLGLKGKVKVLKQEEYYKGNSESEIGLKTGSNSFSFKFNETGSKIEERYYDSEGMIEDKSEYTYTNDGQKTEKKITDLDNKILQLSQYEYDEFGRLININVTKYEDNSTLDYYMTLKYDENNNEISSITYMPNGKKVQSTENKFENNKKIKTILYDDLESPYAICEYKYNEKGDVKKEIFYTGNNLLFEEYSMEYTYDSQDNWIKKVYSLNKKHMNSASNSNQNIGVQTITMRTITYY
jgi:hypothetical protein